MQARISSAIRTARAEGSGQGNGSLNSTTSPSPTKRSSVPSWRKISWPRLAWYCRRTLITSSGSAISAKAVKPRRSQNTTVISRRWLSSRRSSPEVTISSAICGGRKRLSAPSRSISASWAATRSLERPVPGLELGRLLLHRIVQRLDPQDRAHPRDQRRVVDRLGQVLVAARIEPGHDVVRIGLRRDQDDRHERQAVLRLELPADLEAVLAGHHDVEQDEIRRLRARRAAAPRRRPWP